jgi:Fe-S cluster biogenesis protein NfuA
MCGGVMSASPHIDIVVRHLAIREERAMKQDAERQRRAERIEMLIQEVSSFPDTRARETTEELMQCLLDMYGEGLARILEITARAETAGQALISDFARDDVVGSLLLVHNLHPVDLQARVQQALDEVRPQLKLHGGDVEFIKLQDGVAYLRLEGSCHGCPSSTITLKRLIEEALNKIAPDLEGLEVDGVAGTAGVAINTSSPPDITCGVPVTFVPPRRKSEEAQLTAPGKRLKVGE